MGKSEAGESEYSGSLKTRKLLIFRPAKNAEHGKIAPNWNASGTRLWIDAGRKPSRRAYRYPASKFRREPNTLHQYEEKKASPSGAEKPKILRKYDEYALSLAISAAPKGLRSKHVLRK